MTLDEALDLLRVSREADAKEVKRAYLRRIRDFRPETDPEGFQRLREAYELAEAVAGHSVAFAPSPALEAPPDPSPEDQPSDGEGESRDRGSQPPGRGTGPENARRSEEGWEGGWNGEPFLELGAAWDLLHQAEKLFTDRKMKEGIDLTRRALRQAADEYPASPFPTTSVLHILLQLHALDAPLAARRLTAEVRHLALELGGEASLLRAEQDLATWAFLQDLNRLPGEFPAELRIAVARSLREQRPSLATDAVQEFARADRAGARRAAEMLEKNQLQPFASAYGPLLRRKRPPWSFHHRLALSCFIFLVLFSLTFGHDLLFSNDLFSTKDDSPPPPRRELLSLSAVPPPELAVGGPRHGWEPGGNLPSFTPTPDPDRIRAELNVLAGDDCGPGSRVGAPGGGTYCDLTRDFLRQLDMENCTAAESTLHRFPHSLTFLEKRRKDMTTLTMKRDFGPYFAHRCLSYFLQRTGGFGEAWR